jgi:hypothetical protein
MFDFETSGEIRAAQGAVHSMWRGGRDDSEFSWGRSPRWEGRQFMASGIGIEGEAQRCNKKPYTEEMNTGEE